MSLLYVDPEKPIHERNASKKGKLLPLQLYCTRSLCDKCPALRFIGTIVVCRVLVLCQQCKATMQISLVETMSVPFHLPRHKP